MLIKKNIGWNIHNLNHVWFTTGKKFSSFGQNEIMLQMIIDVSLLCARYLYYGTTVHFNCDF